MIEHGTYIDFIPAPPKPKTLVWWIVNRDEDFQLGTISWFARWRCYGFYPKPDTVFEKICLHEIAEFCERKTIEHRQKRKAAKAAEGE